MQEKENILMILQESLSALKREDVIKLKELSNMTTHISSIYQDADNIIVAVVIYALSKIVERKHYREYKDWNFFIKIYEESLQNMVLAIKENKISEFRNQISRIRKAMEGLSGNLREYVKDVFIKSEVNRASKIYEHGISMKKTAKILGISIWELAEYAGQTPVADVNLSITKPVKIRIKDAEEILA